MNLDGSENPENMTSADKWILSRVNKLAREAGRLMGEYELGLAAQIVSDFIWDEFCDWYIEFVKPRLYGEGDKTRPAALHTLKTALTSALKLLHPFLPFITEEIYQALNGGGGTIMYAAWPEYRKDDDFPAEEAEIERVKETVKAIRALRAEKGVSPKKKPRVTFVSASEEGRRLFRESAGYIKNLAGASEIAVQADAVGIEEDAACVVVSSGKVFIPLAELLDADGERERLTREKNRLESEAARAAQKLSNPGFVSKAPEKVLALEREKAGKYKEMLESVFRELEKLS
jgi:valyl-tRNA synthetase